MNDLIIAMLFVFLIMIYGLSKRIEKLEDEQRMRKTKKGEK